MALFLIRSEGKGYGGTQGLDVKEGDSRSRGCEFESRHMIPDVISVIVQFENPENKGKKRQRMAQCTLDKGNAHSPVDRPETCKPCGRHFESLLFCLISD